MNSKEGKSPLTQIGLILNQARIEKGISANELAKKLCIGVEQLIALEEGNEKDLPEEVFIKAMINRVSEKLGVNTSQLMQILQSKKENISTEGPFKIESKDKEEQQKKYSNNKFILGIVILTLFTLNQYFLKVTKETSNYASDITNNSNDQNDSIKVKSIKIRSVRPTDITIIDNLGKIIFQGTLTKSITFPVNKPLEVYALRPDLIRIISAKGEKRKLGNANDLKWYEINNQS